MLLKWIFNALLFLWLYHAVVRPLFLGYFYRDKHSGTDKQSKPETPTKPHAPRSQRFTDQDGEYIDYEEIKK